MRYIISLSLTSLVCVLAFFGLLGPAWPILGASVMFFGWALGAKSNVATLLPQGKTSANKKTAKQMQEQITALNALLPRLPIEVGSDVAKMIQAASSLVLRVDAMNLSGSMDPLVERKFTRWLFEYLPDTLTMMINLSVGTDQATFEQAKSQFVNQQKALQLELADVQQSLTDAELTRSRVQTGFLNEKFKGIDQL